jgi:protein-L-isoaspartate(D-aspartate) O-methyltransferase
MDPRRQALLDELSPDVADERVLAALLAVPRDRFVPAELAAEAWENRALPIGGGQTISQPLVVARMCELLELTPSDHVLEIGGGSGYHAAVLSQLSADVLSFEVQPALAAGATAVLAESGFDRVTMHAGDGLMQAPAAAPFDAVSVAAATPARALPALEALLAPDGRLVAPVRAGGGRGEHLVLSRRGTDGIRRTTHDSVRFVPLLGGAG